MYQIRRKLFSQNFLHSRKLVAKLLGRSSIGKNDLVLEIGPGKGIITEFLLKQAHFVLAVEIDSHWVKYLESNLRKADNLTLISGDILNFKLPSLPYKVFANIPFAIEGKILRYLIDAKNPPIDCYLVVMKQFGYRMTAPYKENWFSIIHKPWFDFSIHYNFKRTDFTPVPSVDVVMMRFEKRKNPLIPILDKEKYIKFITEGFGHGLPIFKNLSKKYGREKTRRIFNKLNISKEAKPTNFTLNQWIYLFFEFQLN